MDMRLHCNGKIIKRATWDDVQAALDEIRDGEVFFTLDIMPSPENGPSGLEVQSEDGNYMPVIGMASGYPRDYYNVPVAGGEMIDILGYSYDPGSITRDYERIVSIVKEFFETGDVSPELLKE